MAIHAITIPQIALDFEIICLSLTCVKIRYQIKKFSNILGKKNKRGFILKRK